MLAAAVGRQFGTRTNRLYSRSTAANLHSGTRIRAVAPSASLTIRTWYPLIRRTRGLIGLVQLLEHLVCDCKVCEGLLNEKVVCVIEAAIETKTTEFQ